jgi:glycosyltransferase involved in cell wall biosynthesis
MHKRETLTTLSSTCENPTKEEDRRQNYSCSVIIPCYNEADNIREAVQRVPQMGKFTEIIVVDDGSIDGTGGIVEELMSEHENLKLISHSPNRGKGATVKAGFDAAAGDVLMILDADMTVPPEELPKFFNSIAEGKADFVNGTRFLHPMENHAMGKVNWFGNKFFTFLFSRLLSQRLTDTLCGTKALLRADYQHIEMDYCRWGDFDLLLGAAKLELKVVEVPISYKRRIAGTSSMKPFKDGFLLLKTFVRGVKKIKLDGASTTIDKSTTIDRRK